MIATGVQERMELDRKIPAYSGGLFLNSKLFVCGGVEDIFGKSDGSSIAFVVSKAGKCVELRPMGQH